MSCVKNSISNINITVATTFVLTVQRSINFKSSAESSSLMAPPVQSAISTLNTSPILTAATCGMRVPSVMERRVLFPWLLLQVYQHNHSWSWWSHMHGSDKLLYSRVFCFDRKRWIWSILQVLLYISTKFNQHYGEEGDHFFFHWLMDHTLVTENLVVTDERVVCIHWHI